MIVVVIITIALTVIGVDAIVGILVFIITFSGIIIISFIRYHYVIDIITFVVIFIHHDLCIAIFTCFGSSIAIAISNTITVIFIIIFAGIIILT